MTEHFPATIFTDRLKILQGIQEAAERGYDFVPDALTRETILALEEEAAGLTLELGDHVKAPIYKGSEKQITQMHERAYHAIDDPLVPTATFTAHALAAVGRRLQRRYPILMEWCATEAGYQLYRDSQHHISKHRDRRTDKILAATITIHGTALIGIHEPLDDPDDYTNTRQIDEHEATAGTVMFLRARGLGSGDQVIHDVSPPLNGERLILNLRMRPDILLSPSELLQK